MSVSYESVKSWEAEMEKRFGKDVFEWQFICPSCGHIAKTRDWIKAGAPANAVGYSCIGRWLDKRSDAFSGKPGPCNYAGGGLFTIGPVTVYGLEGRYFDSPNPGTKEAGSA